MGPVAFIGPLTEKGLTDEEGTQLLPHFREYCRAAYPTTGGDDAQAAPAPTVTITQTAPAPTVTRTSAPQAPAASAGEIPARVAAFPTVMRSRPETQGVFAANTDAQLLEWGRGACVVTQGFVAQGQTLEQPRSSTTQAYVAQIATTMSQAGNMDVTELTRRSAATGFFVGGALPTFCPQYSPGS